MKEKHFDLIQDTEETTEAQIFTKETVKIHREGQARGHKKD